MRTGDRDEGIRILEVLSGSELLKPAQTAPDVVSGVGVGLRHTLAENAAHTAQIVASGESLDVAWRFGILQTLDDYASTLRDAPALTGAAELNAAFAAPADHLAERDGWDAPSWAHDPARVANAWYPAVPGCLRADAGRDSSRAFRRRGIYITAHSLNRA
ncbi:MAG TPA: hypothetical protein VIJ18_05500 [Microbacteriaceae bacterium]